MIIKNIFESLNVDQEKAAKSDLGSVLVLAGAGTGKTSTIVARVTYLLSQKKVEAKDIILLTFTKKASIEMKERLKKYIDGSVVDKISVSTFHSLCLGIVKKYYPEKKLIGETDARNLLDTTYSRVIKFTPDGLYTSNTLFSYIENYINSNSELPFSDWLEGEIELAEDNKEFILGQYQLIYDCFIEDKEKYNVLAFADLLVCAREYLTKNKNSIQEVIVDEFQDTNPLQDSTLNAINPNSLFCVGDYDQSIYAFNGADLSIIENFKDRENFQLYNLSKNYRCRKPILDIAERVIANNRRIYPKSLEVMVKASDPIVPYCIDASDSLDQYSKVAELCANILDRKKEDETVAILYRSNGSGNGVELVLREHGIPIERSVKNSFMENVEIRMIFNVIKLVLFKNLEFLEFSNLFNGIVRSSSKEAIESYYNMITHNGSSSVMDGLKGDKAKQIGQGGVFFSDSNESVLSLLDILEFNKHTNPSSFISSILRSEYFSNTINRFAADKTQGDDEKADRIYTSSMQRAEAVLKIGARYSKLQKFYQDMTRPNIENDKTENTASISLLTVHASKGLEYDFVFIIDLNDEMFPNKKLMAKESDEEERRLFYVAVTRGKKEVVCSYAKRDKEGRTKKPSRFLVEAGLVPAPAQ